MSLRKIGLGLIISAICLYFVVRNVRWDEVWQHLSQVNPLLFGFSMLLMLAAYFLMTWRWRYLLHPLNLPVVTPGTQMAEPAVNIDTWRKSTGLFTLYTKMMTGYFFNAFFPARAGDLVRAYLLSRKTGLRKTTVLATIVIEKALDGVALLMMLLLSLLLLPSVLANTSTGLDVTLLAWVAGIGLLGAVAGMALFYGHNTRIVALVERLAGALPIPDRIQKVAVRLVETFAGGMHVLKNPRPLIVSLCISIAVWLVVALMFLTAMQSFSAPFPSEMMGVVGLFFLVALINLGLLVPALPGNVGTYEALVIAGMAFFRVDKELAVAFALVFHVGQLVVTLLAGGLAFWMQHLSLGELRPGEQVAEGAEDEEQ